MLHYWQWLMDSPKTDLLNYSLSRKHELNVPLFQGSDRREEDQNPFVGD